MRLLDDLYAYPWESMVENNCNTYLIDGKVPTLIDPGHHHLFPQLRDAMAADGFQPEDIQLIIATHAHPDHFEAVEDFLNFDTRIALHPEAEQFIEMHGEHFFEILGKSMPAYRRDFHLVEGELKLGEHRFQVIQTPGHAPGSICLYWPEAGALFTGDVIFSQSLGRTDLPGGNGPQLKEAIDRLAELEAMLLLPGHGPVVRGASEIKKNFHLVRSLFYGMI